MAGGGREVISLVAFCWPKSKGNCERERESYTKLLNGLAGEAHHR